MAYADISGANINPDESHYLNYVPDAGYMRWLQGYGLSGFDNQSRWGQSQQGRYYNNYMADAARNPTLGFYDWLLGRPSPKSEYETLGPDARGEQQYRSFTPRAKWVMGGY